MLYCELLQLADVPHWPASICEPCMDYLDDIHQFRTIVLANQKEIQDKFIPDDVNWVGPEISGITPEFDDIIEEDYTFGEEECATVTNADIRPEDTVQVTQTGLHVYQVQYLTQAEVLPNSDVEVHESDTDGDAAQDDEQEIDNNDDSIVETEESRKRYMEITKKKKELAQINKHERPSLEQTMKDMDLLYCYLCNAIFESFKSLQNHFNETHKRNVAIYCCGQEHIRNRGFDHVRWHQDKNAFKCPYCHAVRKYHRRLIDHINEVHMPRTSLTCPKCDLQFISKTMYKQHIARECLHMCPHCDKEFKKPVLLKTHIQKMHENRIKRQPTTTVGRNLFADASKKKKELTAAHNKDRPALEQQMINMNLMFCHVCSAAGEGNIEFDKYLSLREHFKLAHNRTGSIYCCDKEHIGKRAYDHVKWHMDPNAFKCPYCGIVKDYHRTLIDHISDAHTPPTNLACPKCGINFMSVRTYNLHVARECIHKCERCNRTFAKPHILQRHMDRVHVQRIKHPQKVSRDVPDRYLPQDPESRKLFLKVAKIKKELYIANKKGRSNLEEKMVDMKLLFCHMCKASTFEDFSSLRQHFSEAHNRAVAIQCCGKVHIGNRAYDHVRWHLDENTFKCPLCPAVKECYRALLDHVNEVHIPVSDLTCPKCKVKFISTARYKMHLARDCMQNCPHCWKKFRKLAVLKAHISTVHQDRKKLPQMKAEIRDEEGMSDDDKMDIPLHHVKVTHEVVGNFEDDYIPDPIPTQRRLSVESSEDEEPSMDSNANKSAKQLKHDKQFVDVMEIKKDLAAAKKDDRPRVEQEMMEMNLLRCYICCGTDGENDSVTFINYNDLHTHFQITHDRPAAIYCCGMEHKKSLAFDHVKWHMNPNAFKCPYCSTVKKHHRALIEHINESHLPKTDLTCPKCSMEFLTVTKYNTHTSRQCMHKCPHCDKSYKKPSLVTKHINSSHKQLVKKGSPPEPVEQLPAVDVDSIEGQYIPDEPEARKVFLDVAKTKKELHIATKKARPLIEKEMKDMKLLFCHLCNATGEGDVKFENFNWLRDHFSEVHDRQVAIYCCDKEHIGTRAYDHVNWHLNPYAFKCPYCDVVREYHRALLDHINGVHMPDSALTCQKCHLKFISIGKYKWHIARECLHDCPHCEKQFRKPALLKRHIDMVHEKTYKVKLFICSVCGKSLYSKPTFDAHMVTHGVKSDSEPISMSPKKQCCDICGVLVFKIERHKERHH